MEYISRLRQFRQESKITQRNMAELLSITQQQYFKYEAGQNELPIRYLVVICKHFKISADWLLGINE